MRKYLKDMEQDELEKIFENVESISQEMYKMCYEDNMQNQEDLGDIFFGKDSYEYIEIKDHYSSFYLKLKNAVKFFENLDIENYQYLDKETGKTYIKLYKNARKYYNTMIGKCNYGSDKYYEYLDRLEDTLKEILKILENELHSFESIDMEDLKETFLNYVGTTYQSYYIEDNDYTKVYEDIAYTKTYE